MELKICRNVIVKGFEEFRCLVNNDVYMEMMVRALAMIPSEYILYDEAKHSESTSMTEFYHKWRILLDENNLNDLHLNTEVVKHFSIAEGNKWKAPDMILHHSQADNDDNRIACEVKRQGWSNDRFEKDMNTLNLLLTAANKNYPLKENFKWGVFIQFGGSIEKIEECVRNQSFNRSILCVVVNDDVSQITIKTIDEISKSL